MRYKIIKKSDFSDFFIAGMTDMTTRTLISRWVSARWHLGDTRILESLMISIQIIIKRPLHFSSHYQLYYAKSRKRKRDSFKLIKIGDRYGSSRNSMMIRNANPMLSILYITRCTGSGAKA